ncbi:uncharacterized protein LOC129589888 [Paramacrobiotus metropolitanus]|uniref:uncharacterized protein LOC129589888 n=1 Tax=Paramacrobiotus metropolitanus TaxID=2943436 RepID=UPI0024463DE8|nr:uncharacterized protein LOC129589888 [Paramacrobiotus metropolitanus]
MDGTSDLVQVLLDVEPDKKVAGEPLPVPKTPDEEKLAEKIPERAVMLESNEPHIATFDRFLKYTWIILRVFGLVQCFPIRNSVWRTCLLSINVAWCAVISGLLIIISHMEMVPQLDWCSKNQMYMKRAAVLWKTTSSIMLFISISVFLKRMPKHFRNAYKHYLESTTFRISHTEATAKSPSLFKQRTWLDYAVIINIIAAVIFVLSKYRFLTRVDILSEQGTQLYAQTDWDPAPNLKPFMAGRKMLYRLGMYAGIIADVQLLLVRGVVITWCVLTVAALYNWQMVIPHTTEGLKSDEEHEETVSAWHLYTL